MPRLDWKPRFDERSRKYSIRSIATGDVTEVPGSRRWTPGPQLDQGMEGACVGHGVVGALTTSPHRLKLPDPQAAAFGVYRSAQRVDEWPGEAYEGTSVLAGAAVAKELGLIRAYRWCFGLEDVLLTLRTLGPVVIGIHWLTGMEAAGQDGLLDCSGRVMGGHCAYLNEVQVGRKFGKERLDVVRLQNSWGKPWAQNGHAWMRLADLAMLLRGGEACYLDQS